MGKRSPESRGAAEIGAGWRTEKRVACGAKRGTTRKRAGHLVSGSSSRAQERWVPGRGVSGSGAPGGAREWGIRPDQQSGSSWGRGPERCVGGEPAGRSGGRFIFTRWHLQNVQLMAVGRQEVLLSVLSLFPQPARPGAGGPGNRAREGRGRPLGWRGAGQGRTGAAGRSWLGEGSGLALGRRGALGRTSVPGVGSFGRRRGTGVCAVNHGRRDTGGVD